MTPLSAADIMHRGHDFTVNPQQPWLDRSTQWFARQIALPRADRRWRRLQDSALPNDPGGRFSACIQRAEAAACVARLAERTGALDRLTEPVAALADNVASLPSPPRAADALDGTYHAALGHAETLLDLAFTCWHFGELSSAATAARVSQLSLPVGVPSLRGMWIYLRGAEIIADLWLERGPSEEANVRTQLEQLTNARNAHHLQRDLLRSLSEARQVEASSFTELHGTHLSSQFSDDVQEWAARITAVLERARQKLMHFQATDRPGVTRVGDAAVAVLLDDRRPKPLFE